MNFAKMIADTGALGEQLTAWLMVALPNLVAALLILLVGWWLAGRLERGLSALLNRQGRIDETLRSVLTRLVRYGVMIVVFVAALSQLGIATTSILAALGAIGLAVGLALQNTLSNIAAGIMLLWLRPFSIGDFIEADAGTGTIEEIGLFATRMVTVEGVFMFVPNSELWNKRILNYTRKPKRMIRETFTVSYDDDIEKARGVLTDLLSGDGRIHDAPEPMVKVNALGDSAVELEVRAWTDTGKYVTTRWDIIERAKLALEAEGLTIPYPQQDLHIKELPSRGNGAPQVLPAGNA